MEEPSVSSIKKKFLVNKILISFDGIAPVAKLNQQKNRRYKSWFETQVMQSIKNENINKWNSASITPGTAFMDKLHNELMLNFNEKNIIITSSKEKNKAYFLKLMNSKEAIEQTFGKPLNWLELSDNKMSAVTFKSEDLNLYNDNHWERMNQFFVEHLPKFENAFGPFIKNLK